MDGLCKHDKSFQVRLDKSCQVRGTPSYFNEIEQSCHVEEETDGKPWFYDIKRYIQKFEYPLGALIMRKGSSGAWLDDSFKV